MTLATSTKLEPVSFGPDINGVTAAFSLRDTGEPGNYSMRRVGPDGHHFQRNLADFACAVGFKPDQLVLTRKWPHEAKVRVVDPDNVIADERGGLNPYAPTGNQPGFEHSCDGLITQSRQLVIGCQGADCPTLFLHDPVTQTIGLIHCGWKPVARCIVFNAISVFQNLGARRENIRAHIGPGAGDDQYVFNIDQVSRPVLLERGRLADFEAHQHTVNGENVLRLNALVESDLKQAKIDEQHITNDTRSCIEDTTLHSYRRDGTRDVATSPHGLGMSVMFLH